MYEVASDNSDGTVCESDGKLRKVVECGESGYGELLAPIVDGEGALTPRDACLLLQLVQSPYFQHRLSREIFGYGDEKRSALDLLHVRNCACIMGLERAHNLEGLRHDANNAICAAQKYAFRSRCNARDIPDLLMFIRLGG